MMTKTNKTLIKIIGVYQIIGGLFGLTSIFRQPMLYVFWNFIFFVFIFCLFVFSIISGIYLLKAKYLRKGIKYSIVNQLVLEDLEKRGFVYKIENYKHRYPHCWRCGEELVFRMVDEWYIKCKEIREKLKKENKKIKWYPKYGKKRQDDWFDNMSDWLISRKRYWGLPLPIWECDCRHIHVIGSLEELREKAVDKKIRPVEFALHDGEDFELLFTLQPAKAKRLHKQRKFKFTCIGEIVHKRGGLQLKTAKGRLKKLNPKGYTHF